ncbi:hypothetical protein D9V29_02595 [Mycetocola manganoxydans]|uniref:Alternate-type signal peptide domain-containing protein n=1 Tax=Mycetocola manganoxydans TaxID=699879 RepID=A0A3L6ZYL8_9MICO|nr:SipW-dependent-type signal peptide-containing protein [Mycetocola manganoxydans]RLP72914.1 hypothetical protein D9V29_02595 [Mycetocola manganoxydans]GHD45009.1 hypothetical protein GCM10008097_13730 [Mycetocola manganoxydans]
MATRSSKLRAPVTKPVALALTALVAAAALIGGPVTMAYWNDATEQTPQQIESGLLSITAGITATYFDLASASDVASTVSAPSAQGLIPGKRGQKITYTLASGSGDAVQSRILGSISAPATSVWTEIYSKGYLAVNAETVGECTVNQTPGAPSWVIGNAPGQTLKPGESCKVTVTLSIPAVANISGKNVDVSRALLNLRGSASLNPLVDFAANATLAQVPRAEEN